MTQQTISVVIPFQADPGRVQAELSASWGNPLRGHAKRALDELALVHFFGAHAVGGRRSNHLVLELCVDGSPEHALAQVCSQLSAQLQRLLRSAGLPVPLHLYDYLRQHQPQLGLGWGDVCGMSEPGSPAASVRRIRAEAELAVRAKALIDELSALPMPALAKLCRLRETLWSEDGLKWAFEPQALLSDASASSWLQAMAMSVWPLTRDLLWPLMLPAALGAMVGAVAGPWSALGLGGSVLVLELAWLVWLYKSASREPSTVMPPATRAGMAAPRSGQNHLMLVAELDRGWLGRLGARSALFAIRQMALHLFAPGQWSGALGAHASRWLVLDRSSQLLFLAHHDADTDSFVGELARKSYLAQVAVWSNAVGFPRVAPLLAPAASDVEQVKAWALQHQQATRAWYSAYPELSTADVVTHAAIRRGIATISEEATAARWLSTLGATTSARAPGEPETTLEPWSSAPVNTQVSDKRTA